jgi:hypothetical protein
MPSSDFVYEEGEPIDVGTHGDHDFLYHEGDPVNDSGQSSLVFEGGTGLGGGVQWTISDDQGSVSATLQIISDSQSVEDFYGWDPNAPTGSAATGDVLNYAADPWASLMLYQEESSNTLYLVVIYDTRDSGNSGDVVATTSGLPGSATLAVEDDPGDDFSDVYALSPPTLDTDHNWLNNTDGFAVSVELGETVAFSPSTVSGLDKVQAIGQDGAQINRPFGTDTTVEVDL